MDQELDDNVATPEMEEEKIDPEEYFKKIQHPDYGKEPELKDG